MGPWGGDGRAGPFVELKQKKNQGEKDSTSLPGARLPWGTESVRISETQARLWPSTSLLFGLRLLPVRRVTILPVQGHGKDANCNTFF